jgi:hypothetical protein
LRNILLALTVLSIPFVAAAQRSPAVDPGIQKAIEDHYFKAHATGSGDPLKGMFIGEGRMMSVQDGQLRVRTSSEYIAGFQGKPAADEAKRKRRVLMTDVAGDTAIAKVELDYPDVLVTDYFSLLRIGGEWKIVHKTFHRQAKRPS